MCAKPLTKKLTDIFFPRRTELRMVRQATFHDVQAVIVARLQVGITATLRAVWHLHQRHRAVWWYSNLKKKRTSPNYFSTWQAFNHRLLVINKIYLHSSWSSWCCYRLPTIARISCLLRMLVWFQQTTVLEHFQMAVLRSSFPSCIYIEPRWTCTADESPTQGKCYESVKLINKIWWDHRIHGTEQ